MFKRTDQQQAIADYVAMLKGNIGIEAVAGSGKTTTAIDLIENFIPRTQAVLYMAFNKKIQVSTNDKFKERGLSKATAKTFNSLAYGAYMQRYGIKSFNDIKMDDAKYLKMAVEWVNANMSHLSEEDRDIASDIIANLIHFARVNTTYAAYRQRDLVVLTGKTLDGDAIYTPLPNAFFDEAEDILETIAWRYDLFGQLENANDEMRLLKAIPALLRTGKTMMEVQNSDYYYVCNFTDQVYWMVVEQWRVWKSQWVIVDEAQDLSPLFRALVDNAIWYPSGHVIVIGDPRQAIYAFTGADNSGFQNSMKFWNAEKVFPLTFSWRCPKKVAELAREWVPAFEAAPNAIDGEVLETSEEALVRDALPGEAIISRTRGPMIPIWQKLVGAGKPAIIIGSDVSKQIVKILERVSKRKGFEFGKLVDALREYETQQVQKMVARKKGDDEINNFRDQMSAVNGAVDAVQADSMPELIEKIKAIFSKNDEAINESDAVVIMTGHQSKGLEFDTVYMLTPGLFPLKHPKMSADQEVQELNLKYVVQTRAMRRLVLVTSKKEPTKKEEKKLEVTPHPLEAAIDELDAAVQKLLEAPVVEVKSADLVADRPRYNQELVEQLITECLNHRDHTGHPIMMINRLRELAVLADKVRKSGSNSGGDEAVAELVCVVP